MATVTIITVEDVLSRMGLPDVDGVSNTIESAMVAARVRFEGLLDTPFVSKTRSDIFFLEKDRYPTVLGKYFRCRLSGAFVDINAGTLIRVAQNIEDTPITLAYPDFKINAEKGILHIAEKYEDYYVYATYLSGFTTSNKAPEWLQEAVLAYIPFVLNNQQSTNRSTDQEGVAKKIADMSGEMVEPYMRGVAFQYRPVL